MLSFCIYLYYTHSIVYMEHKHNTYKEQIWEMRTMFHSKNGDSERSVMYNKEAKFFATKLQNFCIVFGSPINPQAFSSFFPSSIIAIKTLLNFSYFQNTGFPNYRLYIEMQSTNKTLAARFILEVWKWQIFFYFTKNFQSMWPKLWNHNCTFLLLLISAFPRINRQHKTTDIGFLRKNCL